MNEYPIYNGGLRWTFAEIDKDDHAIDPEQPWMASLVTVLGCEDTPDRWCELVNTMGEETVLHTLPQLDELIAALQAVRAWIVEGSE